MKLINARSIGAFPSATAFPHHLSLSQFTVVTPGPSRQLPPIKFLIHRTTTSTPNITMNDRETHRCESGCRVQTAVGRLIREGMAEVTQLLVECFKKIKSFAKADVGGKA
jgi:hypothetical protein